MLKYKVFTRENVLVASYDHTDAGYEAASERIAYENDGENTHYLCVEVEEGEVMNAPL